MAGTVVEKWVRRADRGDLFTKEELEEKVLPMLVAQYANDPEPETAVERARLAATLAETAVSMITEDTRWERLAARIVAHWIQDHVGPSWRNAVQRAFDHRDEFDVPFPRVSRDVHRTAFEAVKGTVFQNSLRHERDLEFTYVGICTVLRTYLLWDIRSKSYDGVSEVLPLETPQMMYMRVATAIHVDDEHRTLETYDLLSTGKLSVATPALCTLGTPTPTPFSCYLHPCGDSIDSIYETLKRVAIISSQGGGYGGSFTDVRATGSLIRGNAGRSNGTVPMLRNFNTTAMYVDQGNRRPAAIACYMEPWHADIRKFLDIRVKTGNEEERCHNLNTAVWVPDLLMKRAKNNEKWSLFCPHEAPGMSDVWGDEFEALYTKYEHEGRAREVIPAREVFDWISASLADNGEPYVMFKDTVNRLDNQNVGTIKSSNLCVTGDTELLTLRGPIRIGTLVPDTGFKSDTQETLERYRARVDELEKSKPSVCDEDDPSVKAIDENIRAMKQAIDELPAPPAALTKAVEVDIWTGDTWTKATPSRTGRKKDVMRVTTSHGCRIDCTPDHEFILENGSLVKAKDLHLGMPLLYTRPVPYITPKEHTRDITERDAFFLGAVYGYGLRQNGMKIVPHVRMTLKATALMFRRSTLTQHALTMFEYNEKDARAKFKDVNHDDFVVIEVPEHVSMMRTIPDAALAKREVWCGGFIVAVESHMFSASTSWHMLHPVLMMFRSTGEHLKMVPMGRNEMWFLAPVKLDAEDRDVPKVAGLQLMNAKEDTFCVSTARGAAVFNGQITGNCAEIVQYSDSREIAVCCLSSIGLDEFVCDDLTYDFKGLHAAAKVATRNLDNIIDVAEFARSEMERSAKNHRSIGIGVMGYHTALLKMRVPMATKEGTPNERARELTSQWAECIYHAAIEATAELAKERGPHPSFMKSRSSRGMLHMDLFPKLPDAIPHMYTDWDELRVKATQGRRNAHVTAAMPTATTSLIRGKSEGRNPIQSNIYKITVQSGEFVLVNNILIEHLKELGLWSEKIRVALVNNNGTVRGLGLPEHIETLYATAWEIPQSVIIKLSSDWQKWTDQACSTNVHLEDADPVRIQRCLFYAWEQGCKTGVYYLRTRPATDGVDVTAVAAAVDDDTTGGACSGGGCTL